MFNVGFSSSRSPTPLKHRAERRRRSNDKQTDENVFDFEIPKFNVAETYALLKHYEEAGKCSRGINKQIALEFKALTNGKVKEIQEYLMFQNAWINF